MYLAVYMIVKILALSKEVMQNCKLRHMTSYGISKLIAEYAFQFYQPSISADRSPLLARVYQILHILYKKYNSTHYLKKIVSSFYVSYHLK